MFIPNAFPLDNQIFLFFSLEKKSCLIVNYHNFNAVIFPLISSYLTPDIIKVITDLGSWTSLVNRNR